jgi:hypothetical protein
MYVVLLYSTCHCPQWLKTLSVDEVWDEWLKDALYLCRCRLVFSIFRVELRWYNGEAAVMALNREREMVFPSEPTHECAGSRLSPPENLVSTVPCAERCNRTWNNRSLTGQGSNSATCRICRVSRRRSGHVISRAVGRAARKPFCFPCFVLKKSQATFIKTMSG